MTTKQYETAWCGTHPTQAVLFCLQLFAMLGTHTW